MVDQPSNEEEFNELLRKFLHGGAEFDPAQLAAAAGLPSDPASVARLINLFTTAINSGNSDTNWDLTRTTAESIASAANPQISELERADIEKASRLAELWLEDATTFGASSETLRLLTRRQWIDATLPAWIELASPVGANIARAVSEVMQSSVPSELAETLNGAEASLQAMGHTMFAMQLGTVVGNLSMQVVSGGDVSMPVLKMGQPGLIVANLNEFAEGLELPLEELHLFVLLREHASARLFQHARWLGLHVESAIRAFATEIHIDVERVEEAAQSIDPADAESLRNLVSGGSLIPPRTEAQQRAVDRIEHIVALIEAWVDVVTESAAARLPSTAALSEVFRRRRATGAPAERAFGALVGLELRPRRQREAAELWRLVSAEHGIDVRDQLWSHPDRLPTERDLDDPALFIRSLHLDSPQAPVDDIDEELQRLLDQDGTDT